MNDNYSTTYDMWIDAEQASRLIKSLQSGVGEANHITHMVIIAKAKNVSIFVNGDEVVSKDK